MESLVWDLGESNLSLGDVPDCACVTPSCAGFTRLLLHALSPVRSQPAASPPGAPTAGARGHPVFLVARGKLTGLSAVQSIATSGFQATHHRRLTTAPAALSCGCSSLGEAARYPSGRSTTRTPRHSKPMAIEQAMCFVKASSRTAASRVPAIYINGADADLDLGRSRPSSADCRGGTLTGAPARIVAGSLHVRGDDFWRGWRRFFTVSGQLTLQVAREYYVGNIWRHNIRAMPVTGVPGAFYCTWSEIFLSIPPFLGYLKTLRRRHWLGWWIGVAPPRFSESLAEPIPELIAGDTDDTVTAYVGLIARYVNGRFVFDPPRSPVHALCYMLRSLVVDRPIRYEPEAKVFTSSPTTVRALFRQRKRWNTSRIELTLRFWRAIGYHWGLGLPVMVVKLLLARSLVIAPSWIYLRLRSPGTS
jgi:hypothetical protein